jgi:hypothetical protein
MAGQRRCLPVYSGQVQCDPKEHGRTPTFHRFSFVQLQCQHCLIGEGHAHRTCGISGSLSSKQALLWRKQTPRFLHYTRRCPRVRITGPIDVHIYTRCLDQKGPPDPAQERVFIPASLYLDSSFQNEVDKSERECESG